MLPAPGGPALFQPLLLRDGTAGHLRPNPGLRVPLTAVAAGVAGQELVLLRGAAVALPLLVRVAGVRVPGLGQRCRGRCPRLLELLVQLVHEAAQELLGVLRAHGCVGCARGTRSEGHQVSSGH